MQSTSPLSQNGLRRVKKLYALPEPVPSPHWDAYTEARRAAKKIGKSLSRNPSTGGYVQEIHRAAKNAIKDNLTREEIELVHKGIDITDCYFSADDWENLHEVEVVTRIHSIHSPKSVDVHFVYRYNEICYEPVEWAYSFGFRINDVPVEPLERYKDRSKGVHMMHRSKGWKPFGWFYLDSDLSEHSHCSIRRVDIERIHDALFGSGGRDCLLWVKPDEYDDEDEPLPSIADRITLKHTVQLLLASVGIPFWVSDYEWGNDVDGYDREQWGHELRSSKPGISSGHLRKILHIPRFTMDDTADLTRIQIVPPKGFTESPGHDDIGSAIDAIIEGMWNELEAPVCKTAALSGDDDCELVSANSCE